MDEILQNAELKMNEAIENMKKRFTNVRAGRANPAILDGIMVTYYGNPTPLKSLATISVPEARQLLIKPFEMKILQYKYEIENSKIDKQNKITKIWNTIKYNTLKLFKKTNIEKSMMSDMILNKQY